MLFAVTNISAITVLIEKEQTQEQPWTTEELPCYMLNWLKEPAKETLQKGVNTLPPDSLLQNIHFKKKCLLMFPYSLSWDSVFCRLRDSHSGVIEANSELFHNTLLKEAPPHATMLKTSAVWLSSGFVLQPTSK